MICCQILIFVFLNLLNQFLTIFLDILASSFYCYYFFYFFYFFSPFYAGDPKMGYNRCPLFTILTEQRLCVVSFVKINKTELLEPILSELGWSETLSLQQSPSTSNWWSTSCTTELFWDPDQAIFKNYNLFVVRLNRDPFHRSPLLKPKILCSQAKLRSLSPIPFNQNQSLCAVRLNWDPFRRSSLTRTKICVRLG